jgi:hypothetical protein
MTRSRKQIERDVWGNSTGDANGENDKKASAARPTMSVVSIHQRLPTPSNKTIWGRDTPSSHRKFDDADPFSHLAVMEMAK